MNSDITMPSSNFNKSNDIQSIDQILMKINNLNTDKVNCDNLFNLFCLYGNVDRVKICLNSKKKFKI